MRLALAFLMIGVASIPAQAGVADYCAAYARDFADKVPQQEPQWQHRYDNAEQSCLFRFAVETNPVVKEKAKAKVVVASKATAPAPRPKAKPVVETPAEPEQKVAKAKPNLVPGTPEWVAYCKNKYVSFNEAKGTYQSRTGVERKCLVTAD